MGYILSISICMQNFITIFHSVQEIAPLSLFQNLELGKASTNEKCHFAISWANLVNINVYAKVYQNIPLSSSDRAICTFSKFEPWQRLGQSQMSFDYLMDYIMSKSICMQNFITIFHSVREIGPFSLFQNLELGKASTDENVISQFHGLDLVNINVYAKVYQNIPLSLRNRAIFTFSEFDARQSFDRR